MDHIPDLEDVLKGIYNFTTHYFLTIEPYPEESLRYLESLKAEGRVRHEVLTDTPYSYTHPLDDLVSEVGFKRLLSMPLPTYRNNWGPLYRLVLWGKGDADIISLEQAELLKETLIFEAMLRNVELSERLRKSQKERQKFSQQAYQLKKRLTSKDE